MTRPSTGGTGQMTLTTHQLEQAIKLLNRVTWMLTDYGGSSKVTKAIVTSGRVREEEGRPIQATAIQIDNPTDQSNRSVANEEEEEEEEASGSFDVGIDLV
ncbi:hypothetical protein RUM43_001852 [Polyplax serrata]|uniref:Uncharacterized protein n=1 Tax=Polyplax serrata TaxID=468196 RepID=A0AAN8SKD6_POLSC